MSRAAQVAVPSARILQLAKPRSPATLLEEWDPMPKPKPHMSDYNRLLHLASKEAPLSLPAGHRQGGGRAEDLVLGSLLPDLCSPLPLSSPLDCRPAVKSLWTSRTMQAPGVVVLRAV